MNIIETSVKTTNIVTASVEGKVAILLYEKDFKGLLSLIKALGVNAINFNKVFSQDIMKQDKYKSTIAYKGHTLFSKFVSAMEVEDKGKQIKIKNLALIKSLVMIMNLNQGTIDNAFVGLVHEGSHEKIKALKQVGLIPSDVNKIVKKAQSKMSMDKNHYEKFYRKVSIQALRGDSIVSLSGRLS